MACTLQAEMFREAASIGSLDIRLVYYRGFSECRATGWISDSAELARLMGKIDCRGGNTQIGKVLSEARREAVASGVRAVVFVGDAMEEAVDDLCAKAGELGMLKVPVFMFQEGNDETAEQAFREIARLTGGAWCRFDPGAAAQLRELLRAAAAYAAGGVVAQLDPASTVYHVPVALRLTGELDVGALRGALSEVVARHEVLRTTFRLEEGGPVQVIGRAEPVGLEVEEVRGGDEAAVQAWVQAEVARPFVLETGPLFRARLLRVSAAEHVLVLTMHHIVSDGWSLGVLFREVGALYDAFHRGGPSPLAPLPVQYADFAVWQRTWLQGAELERQLRYWREQLAGAPPLLELPTDFPRPAVRSNRGQTYRFTLDAALRGKLEELSRQEGVTLYMTLLAAFQVLLGRYSGQTDVVVGSPIAGRTRVELEGLIGFFVNTLALRTDLSGDPSFRTLLQRVRETTLSAYAHQDLPFERLVESLAPERSLSRTPLIQVMLVLQNVPTVPLVLSEVTVADWPVEDQTAEFDLTLHLRDDAAHGLTGCLQYDTSLFAPPTIAQLAEHFRTLLTGIVIGGIASISGS